MKIIKIEITAFGALKNYIIEPKNNLMAICEHNGYGKSTICSFICAMLYGLPKKSAKNNMRARAIPYDESIAGGTLELEVEGRLYRIIGKFFNKQKDDSLLFYEGSSLIDAIPGEYLFKIDCESFMRTVFISPYDLEIKTTSDINSKLGHYSANTSDELSFDRAMSYLDSIKKEYKPLRGSDVKGYIAVSKTKIANLKNIINNLKSKEAALNNAIEEYNFLKQESLNIDHKYKVSAEAEKINAYFSYYSEKKEQLNSKKNELKNLLAKYPNGILSLSSIEELECLIKENDMLKIKQSNSLLSLDDEKRLQYLKAKFENLPTNEEINAKRADVISLGTLVKESNELKEDEKKLLEKYQYVNKDELLNKIDKLNDEYNQTINVSDTNIVNNNRISSILLIISIACFLGGLGVGFINKYLFVIAALGLIFLFLSAFLYLNNKVNYQTKMKENNSQQMKRKEEIILSIDKILTPFGFSSELNGNKDIAITLFKGELVKYDEALKTRAILEERNINNKERIALINNELDSFVSKYGYDTKDYGTALDYIVKDIFSYNELLKKQKINEEKNEQYRNALKINEAKIDAIRSQYQISTQNLEEYLNHVRIDLNVYLSLQKEINLLAKDASDYYIKNDLANKKISNELVSSEELHQKYNETLNKLSVLANSISSLENDLEMLDDYEQSLANESLKFEKLNHNYDIISKTIDFLNQASFNIKNKYIKPVKDSFLYYANMLNALGINVMIDEEYNISFKDGMTIKEYSELSSGEMTSVMLCYRLAIMDNIFNERPFIILDDVFQALDSENFLLVKKMLIKLSEHQQIIYFTCHESRMI